MIADHFAVPVFDTDGTALEPYTCTRCGRPVQPDGSGRGWVHLPEDDETPRGVSGQRESGREG